MSISPVQIGRGPKAFRHRRLPPECVRPQGARPQLQRLERMMRRLGLHTVCEEARCPNRPECWPRRAVTFMLLGDLCTRACRFCAVANGKPLPPDPAEPGSRRPCHRRALALPRGVDLRQPGRSHRRRLEAVRADHLRDPGDRGRGDRGGIDPGLWRRSLGCFHCLWGGAGCLQPQRRDRARGSILACDRGRISSALSKCSPRRSVCGRIRSSSPG